MKKKTQQDDEHFVYECSEQTKQKAQEITDYFISYLNKGKKTEDYDDYVNEVAFMLEND